MSLDEKLRTGSLSRREFLELGALGIGALALGQCKASSPTMPEPPVPVTLNFEVYNHTQGYRTSFSKTVMSGEQVIIRVGELKVDDVDPQRIAVREDGFGRLVRFSNTGEASFAAPKQSTNYDVILFNKLRPGNTRNCDQRTRRVLSWFTPGQARSWDCEARSFPQRGNSLRLSLRSSLAWLEKPCPLRLRRAFSPEPLACFPWHQTLGSALRDAIESFVFYILSTPTPLHERRLQEFFLSH